MKNYKKKILMLVFSLLVFVWGNVPISAEATGIADARLTDTMMVTVANKLKEYDTESMTVEEQNELTTKLIETLLTNVGKAKYSISGNMLNKKEKELAAKHPFEAVNCFNMATIAENAARKSFGNATTDGTDGNAFQHFYWNILMTHHYGATVAERWGTAHEYGKNDIFTRMDLANNAAGRNTYNDCRSFTIGMMGWAPTNHDLAEWGIRMIFTRRCYKVSGNYLIATTGATYRGTYSY